jgi:hypothetical protein
VLDGLDRADAGGGEHVALADLVVPDRGDGRLPQADLAARDRPPRGVGLVADVDHLYVARLVRVGEVAGVGGVAAVVGSTLVARSAGRRVAGVVPRNRRVRLGVVSHTRV